MSPAYWVNEIMQLFWLYFDIYVILWTLQKSCIKIYLLGINFCASNLFCCNICENIQSNKLVTVR